MSSAPEQPGARPPMSLAEMARLRAEAPPPAPVPTPAPIAAEEPVAENTWRKVAPPPATPSPATSGAAAPVSTPSVSPPSATPAPLSSYQRSATPYNPWGKNSDKTRALKERAAEVSRNRLNDALRELLGQADDTLYKFVEQSTSTPNQEFIVAFKALRLHRSSVERSFKDSIDRSWGLIAEKQESSRFGGLGGLSLVDEDELEENLAESLAVAQADRLMAPEAAALSRRLVIIDALPETETPSNPLAAGKVAEAFKSAMKEVVDLPATAKMIVFKLFDRHVLSMLPTLLAEVNQVFVDAGVLPEVKPVIAKSAQETKKQAEADAKGGDGEGTNSGPIPQGSVAVQGYSGPVVPWEAFQTLLAAHRPPPPMVRGPNGEEMPAPTVPMQDLISAIQHLNESVAKLDSLDPLAVKKALSDNLASRDSKEHAHPETLGVHEDAIDMIDLLFDYILRDSDLPSTIQTALARLQIPFLRIAVLEPEMFAKPDHPARLLLNTLSEAGKTYTEQADRTGELRKLIASTVETVLEQFEKGSHLCQDLNANFRKEWDGIRERATRFEKRNTEAAQGKDRLERARQASAKAIVNNLAGLVLPDRLRMAIHRAWAHYMTLMALREGEDSAAFRRASRLLIEISNVARSVPGAFVDSNRRSEIESMLTDWSKGLQAAGLGEEEASSWRSVLAEYCNEKLGAQIVPTNKVVGTPALAHEDIAASATQSALPDEDVSVDAMDVVKNMKLGTWVQWSDPPLRAKLAWTGAFTGKLMFVDYRGNKAVETHKQVLAREIELKKATVLSDSPIVEQALSSIEKKLAAGEKSKLL